MNLPDFQCTEQALAFGRKHYKDASVLTALHAARKMCLALVKTYLTEPKTKTGKQLAMHHAFKAQLYREALEAASERSKEDEYEGISKKGEKDLDGLSNSN